MSVITDNTFGEKLFQTSDFPKELESKLFSTIREKLPAEVEDAVIYDIMNTNLKIVKEYFLSLK